MKKLFFILVLIALVAGAGIALKEGMIPGLAGDSAIIKKQTYRFFECIQYKEFTEAANFHNEEDRKKVDIPKLLESLFKMPPENLDFQDITVTMSDVDSSGRLGKTKTLIVVKVLNTDEIRRPEMILYWAKEGETWYLKLESSLQKAPKVK